MLGCHVSGHPRQLALDVVAVDRLRKNYNNGTPRLSMPIQTTPNLPDLCLNQFAHPGDLDWIGRRTRYCEHQCGRIPEVLDVQNGPRSLGQVVDSVQPDLDVVQFLVPVILSLFCQLEL